LPRVGASGGHRHLQRAPLVVVELQPAELVPAPVDAVRRLAGLIAAEHLHLDRHAHIAQQGLVALEGAAQGDRAAGVHVAQLVADLAQGERRPPFEQQCQQAGDPLDG
jgi:hypothetical protein